jgi:hypothetical protein
MGRAKPAGGGVPFAGWAVRELRERGYDDDAVEAVLVEFADEVEFARPSTEQELAFCLVLAEGRRYARRRHGRRGNDG